jgi:hypothetical protein
MFCPAAVWKTVVTLRHVFMAMKKAVGEKMGTMDLSHTRRRKRESIGMRGTLRVGRLSLLAFDLGRRLSS